jgi:N-acetylmuramoyl-L-alanine amidase
MKRNLLVVSIVVIAALLLSVGIYVLLRLISPLSCYIIANDPDDVKDNDMIFAKTVPRPCIVLDAGHGGEDSGAVGIDGVLEKDLNLALTLRLRDLLIFEGWDVILTRDSDILLYDSALQLSHKVQDLKNRLDYGTMYPDAVFVSIHMNQFPAESCKGLQIYYSPNHISSQTLAERMQSDVKLYLSPNNHRLCKKANTAIYILNRIQIPAILVECGFISNSEECGLLQTVEYQKELAAVMAVGLYNEFRIDQVNAPVHSLQE